MAGPDESFDYASNRSYEVLAVILSVVPSGRLVRGPIDRALYPILSKESHPLITENFVFSQYGFSPTLSEQDRQLQLGGAIVSWGADFRQVEIRQPGFFERLMRDAGFSRDELNYLQGVGRKLQLLPAA